jgi:hypothetical protein
MPTDNYINKIDELRLLVLYTVLLLVTKWVFPAISSPLHSFLTVTVQSNADCGKSLDITLPINNTIDTGSASQKQEGK